MEAALGKLPFRLPAAIQKPWSTGLRRSFLRVWGPDAQKFINGLNSNATMELAEGTGHYTAFLTPQVCAKLKVPISKILGPDVT